MKKRVLTKLLCICLSGTLLTRCTGKLTGPGTSTPDSGKAAPPETSAPTEAPLPEKTTPETEPATKTVGLIEIPENAIAWERTYRELLNSYLLNNEYINELLSFSLFDITDDGIPELFVSEMDSAQHIYSANSEGELIDIGEFGHLGGDSVDYDPDQELLLTSIHQLGYYSYTAARITEDYILEHVLNASSDYVEYWINDENVSEEEFDTTVNSLFHQTDMIGLGNDAARFTPTEINYVFGKYKRYLSETFTKLAFRWRRAYRAILNEHLDDDAYRFSLHDINGDNIPELIVGQPSDDKDVTCTVYSFSEETGEAVRVGEVGAYGTVDYIEETGLLYTYRILGTRTESNSLERMTEALTLETLLEYALLTPDDPLDARCYINGEEVSDREYDNVLKAYSAPSMPFDDKIRLGNDFEITEEVIDTEFDRITDREKIEGVG